MFTLGDVIKFGTWHCAVECLVSVSNCIISIFPLLLSYIYDDIVACGDMKRFLRVICFAVGGVVGRSLNTPMFLGNISDRRYLTNQFKHQHH